MRIAPNVEMLEIGADDGTFCPVLIWDENETVLIDTGLPGQLEQLEEAVSKAGFSLRDITKIILTHQDIDHIGNAKIFSGLGARILAHEIEAPYIQGDKTLVKLAEMKKRLNEMDEDGRAFYDSLKKGAAYAYTHVDRLLRDDEMLDFCGGIRVIATPGHTPGHIALLLQRDNILVAGDAANITNGSLTGANPRYTKDMEAAFISFKKIKALNPKYIVCYHGGKHAF